MTYFDRGKRLFSPFDMTWKQEFQGIPRLHQLSSSLSLRLKESVTPCAFGFLFPLIALFLSVKNLDSHACDLLHFESIASLSQVLRWVRSEIFRRSSSIIAALISIPPLPKVSPTGDAKSTFCGATFIGVGRRAPAGLMTFPVSESTFEPCFRPGFCFGEPSWFSFPLPL